SATDADQRNSGCGSDAIHHSASTGPDAGAGSAADAGTDSTEDALRLFSVTVGRTIVFCGLPTAKPHGGRRQKTIVRPTATEVVCPAPAMALRSLSMPSHEIPSVRMPSL